MSSHLEISLKQTIVKSLDTIPDKLFVMKQMDY